MGFRRARRNQAREEVRRLNEELQVWYKECTDADLHDDGSPRAQYHSQLQAIKEEVEGAAEIIDRGLKDIDLSRPVGEVYAECGRIERQTIWLWKVWYYFRDKFDQRQDPRFRDTLRAADEVVWSCYRPYFKKLGVSAPAAPPPLPYIEADHSPAALRRYERNALQRKGPGFDLVKKAFETLPVPILKIPITTVNNPWAMVLIGHETGHYIQPSIQPKFGYVKSFGQAVANAVDHAAGSIEYDRDAWQLWGDEIFADWFSLLTMGQWALWAIALFEIADFDWMLTRRTVYPSPLVRLALMAEIAEQYGLPGKQMLTYLGIEPKEIAKGHEEASRDLKFISKVVPAVIADLPDGQGRLDQLVGFNMKSYKLGNAGESEGEVTQWTRFLTKGSGAKPAGNKKLHSARMVAAGMAQAWSTLVFGSQEPSATDINNLKNLGIKSMIAAAEPGMRSLQVLPKREDPGRSLAELLSHADDDLNFADR